MRITKRIEAYIVHRFEENYTAEIDIEIDDRLKEFNIVNHEIDKILSRVYPKIKEVYKKHGITIPIADYNLISSNFVPVLPSDGVPKYVMQFGDEKYSKLINKRFYLRQSAREDADKVLLELDVSGCNFNINKKNFDEFISEKIEEYKKNRDFNYEQ